MKKPNLKEKVKQYEMFLHRINTFVTACDNEGVAELVANADTWSYMHRVGNGEISDREQDRLIHGAFWRLCDTPKTDKKTEERQKQYKANRLGSVIG